MPCQNTSRYCKVPHSIYRFLNLMEQQDPTVMLKMLLKRLRDEKAIEDTDALFYKNVKGAE